MTAYRELKNEIEDKFVSAKSERDMRFYLLCLLALESGARVSDLLKLSWHALDFDKAEISYFNTKGKKTTISKLIQELVRICYEI